MKIGFVSMPVTGHLNPMTALARKLKSRGHEVVFFGIPDAKTIVRAANLEFVAFGAEEYPLGSTAAGYAHLARLHGADAVRYSSQEMHPRRCKITLEQLPAKLLEAGVEALVIDTIHFFVELIPMRMGMPYVHVWNILQLDRSGWTPPCFFSWPYETTPEALARNRQAVEQVGEILAPVTAVGKAYAEEHGLLIDWSDPTATLSKLAVIAQAPKEFDFPGIPWPAQFHYTGPLHDDGGRAPIPFPWERLTGEPLIYASMGTLVNHQHHVYRTILEAVKTVPGTQLVLSVGGETSLDELGSIPPNAIVVPKAPQIELLKRAVLCVTHAGLNTTLEALAQGVPMVAIPITFDQPGVAARIAYHGVGELIGVENLTVDGLSGVIRKVLKNLSYRDKAGYFEKVIAETDGLDLAADVIEQAFQIDQTAGSGGERTVLTQA